MKENFKSLRETHPGISLPEGMKVMGERWKQLQAKAGGDGPERRGDEDDEMEAMTQKLQGLGF